MNVPESCRARRSGKLMQTRVRNLMAQPAVPAQRGARRHPLHLRASLRHKESNAC
jgi:hypothetical protein